MKLMSLNRRFETDIHNLKPLGSQVASNPEQGVSS